MGKFSLQIITCGCRLWQRLGRGGFETFLTVGFVLFLGIFV